MPDKVTVLFCWERARLQLEKIGRLHYVFGKNELLTNTGEKVQMKKSSL